MKQQASRQDSNEMRLSEMNGLVNPTLLLSPGASRGSDVKIARGTEVAAEKNSQLSALAHQINDALDIASNFDPSASLRSYDLPIDAYPSPPPIFFIEIYP